MKRIELLVRILTILICLGVIAIPLGIYYSGRDQVIHARIADEGGWSPQTIRAVVGETLELHLTSDDVVHGFGIGQFDLPYVDIEPGKLSHVSVTFDQPGTYTFFCTRWCGLNHWRMRGTIEVSGEPAREITPPSPPLYVNLGIDIDAPHLAGVIPGHLPSAARESLLVHGNVDMEHFTSSDYYRSHSPAQAFLDLEKTGFSSAEKWDVVAAIWRSNTTGEGLEEGRRLFAENCAACHGENGAGDGVFADDLASAGSASAHNMTGAESMSMQKPADFTDPGRMLGASPALLQGKIIRGGMGTGMPMWGVIFTEQQTWNIIAYLYGFQFNYESQ